MPQHRHRKRARASKRVEEPIDFSALREESDDSRALAGEDGGAALPGFLLRGLTAAYGLEGAREAVRGFAEAQARPVTLRANTLSSSAEEVAAALEEAGIAWRGVSWSPDAFALESATERDVWALPVYEQGGVYLQSLSSQLPALALDPIPGIDILDMCAAPGGKTSQIVALTQGGARVTACEMKPSRADKLEHNLAKLGARNVAVMRLDARGLDEFFRFDQILVDAPCSGSGTLSLSDEKALARTTEALVEKSIRSQRALLARALGALKPGATLVYSTCSILPQENEDVVRWALKRVRDCELIPLDGTLATSQQDVENAVPEDNAVVRAAAAGELPLLANTLPGTLTVRPTRLYEGFYIAKIRKLG